MKVDLSSFFEYIWRSFCNLYEFFYVYISFPPPEALVGVGSRLYLVILRLVATRFFCDSLLLDIQIILTLLDNKLKNCLLLSCYIRLKD